MEGLRPAGFVGDRRQGLAGFRWQAREAGASVCGCSPSVEPL